MNSPIKHHYIPVFYTKGWLGNDNKLCEFSKPYGSRVTSRRVHSAGTGYERSLYSFDFTLGENKQLVEIKLFKDIDDRAAKALRKITVSRETELSIQDRFALLRFIVSLDFRCPEDIELLKNDWSPEANLHAPIIFDHESSFYGYTPPEFDPHHVSEIRMFAALRSIVENVTATHPPFQWYILNTEDSKHELLASDRPVLRTFRYNHNQAFYLFPLCKDRLLLLLRDVLCPELKSVISIGNNGVQFDSSEIVRFTNKHIVEKAVKFVYSRDDSQIRCVRNRMSTESQARKSQMFPETFGLARQEGSAAPSKRPEEIA